MLIRGTIMTKLEFITAFKAACDNLPTDLLEAALADYERQFTDQFLAGVSEQTIVESWGSPQNAALKLKLKTLNGNLKQPVKADKVARICISAVWLAIVDLFAIIPTAIYSGLLSAFYAVSLVVYLTGIFVSATSLTGITYIEIPSQYLPLHFASHFDVGRIHFRPDSLFDDGDNKAKIDKSEKPDLTIGVLRTPQADKVGDANGAADEADHRKPQYDSLDIVSRLPKNTFWNGLGITFAGMVMLVLCFLATRLGFRLLRSFALWQFNILKNA
ncbi:DUF1700 domain-containing protein [Sapientia aquatica]|uniref:DUF1700 domain-containing protein n=2 Tax=Sapientia aquatica TaxID=1549640 RepID=A0A4R5W2I0_9BURK|nr:DUF1700 domain-containing protein [Sapientia aquatica]